MPELGLPASLSNNIKKKKTWSTLSSLAQQKKRHPTLVSSITQQMLGSFFRGRALNEQDAKLTYSCFKFLLFFFHLSVLSHDDRLALRAL